MNGFLPIKPDSHLLEVVDLLVRRGVRDLCKVNMEALGVLGTVSISGAGRSNGFLVVFGRVSLRKVEVLANTEIDEYLLVCVITSPSRVKIVKRYTSVSLEVCKVDEVQASAYHLGDVWVRRSTGDYPEKNALHVLELRPRPLRNRRYPVLEVTKAWVTRHGLEPFVDLLLPIGY